jgi:L-type amino acid transporter 6
VQEFGDRLLGLPGRIIYSLAVAISALGALNTNIFANAKLCVTASQRGYLPALLANLHFDLEEDEIEYYETKLKGWPKIIALPITKFAKITSLLRLEQNIPM